MTETADIIPPTTVGIEGDGNNDPVFFCEGCPFAGAATARLADIVVLKVSWGSGVEAAGAFIDEDKSVSEVFNVPPVNTPESQNHKNPNREFDSQECFDRVAKCDGPEVSRTPILRRERRDCPALYYFLQKRLRQELKQDIQSKRWSK